MSGANRLDFEQPERKSEKRKKVQEELGQTPKPKKTLKGRVPMLPSLDVDPEKVGDPDQRAVACANMRLAGAPFHEIAKALDYSDATSAKAAFIAAMASLNPLEDLETLRQSEAMRAEQLFRRSFAMAGADYLVVTEEGEDGEVIETRVPNTDRLRWHEQAGKDLALHAMITGAKAPSRVEVTATTQELNRMVDVLLHAEGGPGVVEADVFQITELPAEPEEA